MILSARQTDTEVVKFEVMLMAAAIFAPMQG
jgi:hypothetical protein